MLHEALEQFDEERRIESPGIRLPPEFASFIHGRDRINTLALSAGRHLGRLSLYSPRSSQDLIRPNPCLIEKENLRSSSLGAGLELSIGRCLPLCDRFRISLIGAAKRLLRSDPHLGQDTPHSGYTQAHPHSLLD